MEDEKKLIIQKGITEQKQKFDIRKDLVSAGIPTVDFEDVYKETLTSLGMQEPAPPKVVFSTSPYMSESQGGMYKKQSPSHRYTRYVRGVGVFFVLATLVTLGAYFGPQLLKTYFHTEEQPLKWGEEKVQEQPELVGLRFGDEILQTKVKATVASAIILGGRMGSYEGVCNDISVVAPVACKGTEKTFIIYAPMSNGTYFCEDEKQQGSIVSSSPEKRKQCY